MLLLLNIIAVAKEIVKLFFFVLLWINTAIDAVAVADSSGNISVIIY
jgi:hypothetical protein